MNNEDDVARNRRHWDEKSDAYQQQHGAALDAAPDAWGVWRIPEADLNILGAVAGKNILELGCGAAQWSIALARRGARPVELDQSARQLDHARQLMAAAGVDFPLVQASATNVPLPGAVFDMVFCDHGAFSFADPYQLVPEATRLLRPGGRLAFCMTSPWREVCYDEKTQRVGRTLQSAYFGLHRLDDPAADGQVSFQIGYGAWIALFAQHDLRVERLEELRAPEGATSTYTDYVDLPWARDFPAEILWVVCKKNDQAANEPL